jgi:hypothetical protein
LLKQGKPEYITDITAISLRDLAPIAGAEKIRIGASPAIGGKITFKVIHYFELYLANSLTLADQANAHHQFKDSRTWTIIIWGTRWVDSYALYLKAVVVVLYTYLRARLKVPRQRLGIETIMIYK